MCYFSNRLSSVIDTIILSLISGRRLYYNIKDHMKNLFIITLEHAVATKTIHSGTEQTVYFILKAYGNHAHAKVCHCPSNQEGWGHDHPIFLLNKEIIWQKDFSPC